MATETGHAKNIANFENLISIVNGYGPQYNPSDANISLKSLQLLRTNAQASLDVLYNGITSYANAVNARQTAFEDLKKLSTRIVNAVEACGVASNSVDDAVSINRKIQGTRSGKLGKAETNSDAASNGSADPTIVAQATATATETTHISVSQQSFDNLIEHFSRLLVLLTSEPKYKPNEADLALANLNSKLTTMRNTNSSFINSYTEVSNNRISRNVILYGENIGLCDIAAQVKSYVKSIYGATSPNYKLISKIEFKKIKS